MNKTEGYSKSSIEMKYQANKGKICSIPECNNLARVKGLCATCYIKRKRKEKELL